MFPILFFSIASLTFYNRYGINPAADSTIFKTCIAFSVIYIAFYLGMTIYSAIKSTNNYMRYQYISNYVCDVLNCVIIIQSIGSDKAIGLIIITFMKLLGSSIIKYR
jgi:hypothetical protein